MKLVYASASPFVRKVHVLLIETGQMADVELLQVTTTPVNTADEAASANPSGKIPALILADSTALYDSRVICRYLDDRAQSGMYPADTLWKTLTLEATADAMMDAAVLMTYERRVRPDDMVYLPWIEAQWAKIERSMLSIENAWMDYLARDLDMAHIAVACALNYLDFRHPDRDWRAAVPNLAAWLADFNTRPSMTQTQPA